MAIWYGRQQGMGMAAGMGYGYRLGMECTWYGRQQGVVVLTELSLHRPTTTA